MEADKLKLAEAEKHEETKLMQKYPQHNKPSNFLQKKLNRGQKYFDSGDYNMAMQGRNRLLAQPSPLAPTPQSPQASPAAPAFPPVPTVDSIHLQQRKASISQSKLAEESPHHLTHHQGHHPAHTEEASETAQSGGDDM
ncbi:cAMP-regulated phosphoprotein 19-like [Varroa jacobsoni]|uniref:cAMP-regulated phosphoprotein 19 n=1 Tax=Varroa destructor TaxID=109461 RepID=A0A7M7J7G0_VARDE|nr:cAMP-regulated phosphoprotein 19-like [Varroa destructor]XP_022647908.1 cAMP-regulated phosphoprotein 19-like [Varroa destructor]XP_022710068.1 cAMP-regulated phosphoprotein 19-like [Varroa jacobsoni]XP_022710069.1 cAMP-regulated phosphoprotein 19-like [Varroa jacobsoni]XP_022710070.1 cAMP-regulated phosphoprotein 19-like [Varroa jacobsoni]